MINSKNPRVIFFSFLFVISDSIGYSFRLLIAIIGCHSSPERDTSPFGGRQRSCYFLFLFSSSQNSCWLLFRYWLFERWCSLLYTERKHLSSARRCSWHVMCCVSSILDLLRRVKLNYSCSIFYGCYEDHPEQMWYKWTIQLSAILFGAMFSWNIIGTVSVPRLDALL